MTKRADPKKFKPASWIEYAITDVIIRPETNIELRGCEKEALEHLQAHIEETGKWPLTAELARRMRPRQKNPNKTWTAQLLMKLVSWGYICTYQVANKRRWCSRKKAIELLNKIPSEKIDHH